MAKKKVRPLTKTNMIQKMIAIQKSFSEIKSLEDAESCEKKIVNLFNITEFDQSVDVKSRDAALVFCIRYQSDVEDKKNQYKKEQAIESIVYEIDRRIRKGRKNFEVTIKNQLKKLKLDEKTYSFLFDLIASKYKEKNA
jgi:hypothetical protein